MTMASIAAQCPLTRAILTEPPAADIFLGEAGQLLVRNVDFEIPYLKQQAAKEQQQLADFERKHNEHLHSAVQAARQYQQVRTSGHAEVAYNELLCPSQALFVSTSQVHLGDQHTSNTCLLTFAEEVRPVYTVPAGTGTNTHAGM